MRLVKLSTSEFSDISTVGEFFAHDLPQRNPPGKFLFPDGWIAKDGLAESEWILFSFLGRVVRIAQSASGRLANLDEEKATYPNYFVVDLTTVKEVDFLVADLESAMHKDAGVTKSIAVSQGWVRLPDTAAALSVVERLAE